MVGIREAGDDPSVRGDSRGSPGPPSGVKGRGVDPGYERRKRAYFALQDAFVRRREPPAPLVFEIEPTTDCTLACSFCPRTRLTRPRGALSRDDLDKILSNLGDPPSGSLLLFSGFGEPMLHDDLAAIVGLAKGAGWICGITTNGTRLSPGSLEPLLDAGLDLLHVSLHGATMETYERLVPGGSFEAIHSRIRSILPLCRERVVLALNFIVTPSNRKETGAFASYWRGQGVSFINFSSVHNRGGYLEPSPKEDGAAASRSRRDRRTRGERQGRCWSFRSLAYVTWDGRLLACSMDLSGETVRGNLREETLAAIREDEANRDYEPSHPICELCDFPFALSGPR